MPDPQPLVTTEETLLELLDTFLEKRQGQWWDRFFSDRAKPCPFFVDHPDESLVEYFQSGDLRPGKVLELGCGHGRNALYLAKQGCEVDAIDFSEEALNWAKERVAQTPHHVNFICESLFRFHPKPEAYDVVYDCGCFHHIPPHRRLSYLQLLRTALKPGGRFALVCFAPEGGSGLSDLDVYEMRSLKGGLAYTEDSLQRVFCPPFRMLKFRRMDEVPPNAVVFGKDFLWTALMERVS